MNDKTVLILGSFGGSLVSFRGDLILALESKGYRVTVALPDLPEAGQHFLNQHGIEYIPVMMNRNAVSPLADIFYFISLLSLIRKRRPSAILSYTLKPVAFGGLAARICRVPTRVLMFTGLGRLLMPNSDRRSKLKGGLHLLLGLAAGRGSTIVAQNPDDLAHLQQVISSRGAWAYVNGSGINLSRYRFSELPTEQVFLMAARFSREKGLAEYLVAARLVKAQFPRVRFQLAGWWDEAPEPNLARQLAEAEASGVIENLGYVEDIGELLGRTFCYVLPSYREGCPRSVLEAMACGRPVITSDAPGCHFAVSAGENGFCCRVGDVDDLVSSIVRLIREPALARKMGAAGRQRAEKVFDVERVNRQMLELVLATSE